MVTVSRWACARFLLIPTRWMLVQRSPLQAGLPPVRLTHPTSAMAPLLLFCIHSARCGSTAVVAARPPYADRSPDGHYRGSPDVEKELVYVVQTNQGQDTLTPAEFAQKYASDRYVSPGTGRERQGPAAEEVNHGSLRPGHDGNMANC